jgi:hypothetical protein
MTDDVRLLHRNPTKGYTRSSSLALREEAEAVSAEEQERQSDLANARPAQEWRKAETRIVAVLDHFQAQAGHIADREVRAVRRTAAAVGRRLSER